MEEDEGETPVLDCENVSERLCDKLFLGSCELDAGWDACSVLVDVGWDVCPAPVVVGWDVCSVPVDVGWDVCSVLVDVDVTVGCEDVVDLLEQLPKQHCNKHIAIRAPL